MRTTLKKKYLYPILTLITGFVIFIIFANKEVMNLSKNNIYYGIVVIIFSILTYVLFSSLEKYEKNKKQEKKVLEIYSMKANTIMLLSWPICIYLIYLLITRIVKPPFETETGSTLLLSFVVSVIIIVPITTFYIMHKINKNPTLLYSTIIFVLIATFFWISYLTLNINILKIISVLITIIIIFYLLGVSAYGIYIIYKYWLPSAVIYQQKKKRR